MKTLLTLGLWLVMSAPAWAIPVNPYTYSIVGDLSILGNDSCTPSPCIQNISFSFLFAWTPTGDPSTPYQASISPESVTLTSSGPLLPFTLVSVSPYDSWFALSNAGRDEIDVQASGQGSSALVTESPGSPPAFGGAYLYGCQTLACSTAFTPCITCFEPLEIVAVSDPVPEPSSGLLLALAALALIGAGWRRQNSLSHRRARPAASAGAAFVPPPTYRHWFSSRPPQPRTAAGTGRGDGEGGEDRWGSLQHFTFFDKPDFN